ncbi:MAG: DegT/DnrJ/EryC1/StrS family aminotransferase [Oscillospiraceae bacterium]
MSAPLCEALTRQLAKGRERFHMPGHKGLLPFPLDGCAPFDVTELPETGCLYDGEGPMIETEAAFSAFYHSGATLLSTGGSTLCIQTMLALFCPPGTRVLMARASHLAAVNAAALLGLEPQWLLPDEPSGVGTPGRISPAAVRAALWAGDCGALYLTSPDYFGTLHDLRGISAVCREFGVPLLVDNAHGAQLGLFEGLHPMAQGADACCDSLHKTLPALTGAALLHLRDSALKDEARRRMATFGSTSPSYLLMLSADLCAERLAALRAPWAALAEQVALLRAQAEAKGCWATIGPVDPTRIALLFPAGGREQGLLLLAQLGIEAEYCSDRQMVLIPAPENDLSPVRALIDALPALAEPPALCPLVLPERVLSLRDAVLAPALRLSLASAVGRIAAAPLASCPPGLALVMPGERIPAALSNGNLTGTSPVFVVR